MEATSGLIVPALVMTEVVRRLDSQGRRRIVPDIVAHMRMGAVIALDEPLALAAATVGREYNLALTDSIVYATAREFQATVWTQDADFKDLDGVEYRAHAKRRRG